nr:hypothetical protein [Paracoccus saliphilus]
MSGKMFRSAAGALDKAHGNLSLAIATLEDQLPSPIGAETAGSYGKEIRVYVNGLAEHQGTSTVDTRPGQKALGFVRQAVSSGDEMTVAAVRGDPAYLSGIMRDMQQSLTGIYREKHSPAEAKRFRPSRVAVKDDRCTVNERPLSRARRSCVAALPSDRYPPFLTDQSPAV